MALLFVFALLCLSGQASSPAAAAPSEEQLRTQQPGTPQSQRSQTVIEAIRFLKNRKIPQDTLKARIFSKPGDIYDPEVVRRDFMALWNTGFFEDIKVEVEDGTKGKIIIFTVFEKPTIRTLDFKGMHSITNSDILDRFKERKVGITTESPYDQTKVRRAEVVIEELLAERGRQFATVRAEPRRVPPNSVILTFRIDEGPKVKVGDIMFEGNKVLSDRALRSAMRHLKPIGIPKSIFLESIFAKAYDQTKMAEDLEMIRTKIQDAGYFKALVMDPKTEIRDTGGRFRIPLFYMNKPGKAVDITIPIQEGAKYTLGKFNINGVKFFTRPEVFMRPMFGFQEGDIVSVSKLRKGFEQLKKTYGEFGFINMTFDPEPDFDDEKHIINFTINIDEDKQFFVRRIEFTGNTTTRDKVIRRELLLDEGDMYNSRLWEVSILRLNQLGFFEQMKPDAANVKTDNKTGTVDITLRVKERGKNTIGLTGGVSGIAGSFLGLNYSTNNFLGLGETLSFSVELGTRERNIMFGFTEPYLLDRPIQTGFTIYARRFSYDQAREASILTGQNLIPLYQSLGTANLLNFRQTSVGFTTFASKMLRRSFARVGISYGYDKSSIITFSDASKQYFEFLNFRGVSGPSALQGIATSKIIPTYTFNTINNPMFPTQGKSLYAGLELAGLGGNVRMYRPTASFTYYHPVLKKRTIIGFRIMGAFMSGYGGVVAPPFERFYIGGETDVRGFDIRTISPIAYIADAATINVLNNDGSPRQVPVISNGEIVNVNQTVTIPINRIIFPGGDTQGIGNFEYRIPIFSDKVSIAAFFDAGYVTALRRSQLAMAPSRLAELSAQFPYASFPNRLNFLAGTNNQVRTSTGLELQVTLPIVQAPFRLYWAYNPNRLVTTLQTPVMFDRSLFPNAATFLNALSQQSPINWRESPRTFRFTISRTF